MTSKESLFALKQSVQSLLQQLSPAQYTRHLDLFEGATIGQHVRHIVDFFQCLDRGVVQGTVDYADRERDIRLEHQPGFALEQLTLFMERLGNLDEATLINVLADVSANPEAQRPRYLSSIGREFSYIHDHAVHHLAIIKMGLSQLSEPVLLDSKLGVAPATLRHRESSNQ
ncbi:MAG: hypothetical protein H6555_11545 [Lewinellaceae bacterium]|nr:hypothetical protein [Lewinellaceae bacterium]